MATSNPAEQSRFISMVRDAACKTPEKTAFFNTRMGGLTYGELWRYSDALAAFFEERGPEKLPVVVYGHKSPLMLACFLGALKSGRAYAPIDVAYPRDRVNDILDQIGHPLVVDLSDDGFAGDADLASQVVDEGQVRAVAEAGAPESDPAQWVSGDDVFYLLFTSGSTGRPKGVQMPARCVDAFMDYYATLIPQDGRQVSFNRVPYTFDVSLFDIIPGLSGGNTLFGLEKEAEQSTSEMFDALAASNMTVWVSTPSFAEICLADKSFTREMLPDLRIMILCGEVLRPTTAAALVERFPETKVYNTYGPTETQAVSDIVITPEVLAAHEVLPVGYMGLGSEAFILDPETEAPVPGGQEGEIYLAGKTVSLGYWKRPDLTERAFAEREVAPGRSVYCYKTGDKGYLTEDGLLFCLGRLDFQVKLNGFRIELGDVEQNITGVPYVAQAVVLPAYKEGKPTHLVAHVVLSDPDLPRTFATAQKLRGDLKEVIPEYMLPKKVVFHESFPLNTNGKIDRKAVERGEA